MQRAAQIASGVIALFLAFVSFRYITNPSSIAELTQMNVDSVFGTSNIRAQAATTLSLAILAALGAAKQNWYFLLPVALYFLTLVPIRIYSLIVDGSDSGTIRALILAAVLFVVAEVALNVFRKSERRQADA